MERVPLILTGAAPMAFLVYLVLLERRRLDRAVQRLRELRDEGLEDLTPLDQLPEFRAAPSSIRMPDGTEREAMSLLRRELRWLLELPCNRDAT